jgi:hypothetical protein
VQAAPPPPGDPAAILTRARQLFTEGNKLYDESKLPQAEAAYLEAWKLKKSYDLAGNLGNVEADLKKWRQAAEYLSYAIREFPAGGRPTLRDNMISRLTEAQKYVGQLRFEVRAGAEIFVDGVSIGVAPIQNEVYADPGTHSIEGRLEGFPPAQATVTTARGRIDTVPLTFVAPVTGPNKKVIIAGAVIAGAAAIAGGAMLGLWAAKGSDASSLYTKIRGPSNAAPCADPSQPQTNPDCASLLSDLNSKATFGTTGVVLLSTAGAVGLATLIYGLAGGSRGPRSGLVVSPVLTGDNRGVVVQGSF